MAEITNINLTHLRTDETLGFLKSVMEVTKLVTNPMAGDGVTAFNDVVAKFEAVLKPNLKNSHTMSRREADIETDTIWTGMRMHVDAMTRFPDDEKEKIALKAMDNIKKYGNLNEMGYKLQYPNLSGLLDDLKKIGSDDLAKIGLAEWVDALQTAYDNFIAISTDKVIEDSEKGVGIVQDTRTEAEDGYYAFVKLINALVVVVGEADFIKFINAVNTIIDEYKIELASRKTRNMNKLMENWQ